VPRRGDAGLTGCGRSPSLATDPGEAGVYFPRPTHAGPRPVRVPRPVAPTESGDSTGRRRLPGDAAPRQRVVV